MRRGHGRRSAIVLDIRLGDWTRRNRGKDEDLRLASLLPSLEWPVVSQEDLNCLLDLGAGVKPLVVGGRLDLYDGLERREGGIGGPQQVVCYKARDETGGLDLEGEVKICN